MPKENNRYQQLIEKIFFDKYSPADTSIPFERGDLERAAEEIGIKLPKNLGDVMLFAIDRQCRNQYLKLSQKAWSG